MNCFGISARNLKYPIMFDIRESIIIERFHQVSVNFRKAIYIFFIPCAAICCLTIKLKRQNMVGRIWIKQAFPYR